MHIAILCGGPSAERGISLNSSRSLLDHLLPLGWKISPFYMDRQKRLYPLSFTQLYSNTPADFDFKLQKTVDPLSERAFLAACRECDLFFPLIHGAYGEDGELQDWLEEHAIPFVGSPSNACRLMFDKAVANQHLASHGFATLPHCSLSSPIDRQKIDSFFKRYQLDKVVVKPSAGGSSLGVAVARTPQEAVHHAEAIFARGFSSKALIEPFCNGQEFTVLVIENSEGQPVALLPTEIELFGGDLFTFRHKYLPSCHVEYHCPPRFSNTTISNIQKTAELLFRFFGMRDFARLDGWVLEDGQVLFSDFNPISGMEQNSFLFIQGSRLGWTHTDILRHIILSAARRYHITSDSLTQERPAIKKPDAKKLYILFGGGTAERQVSLMSGTNVWLKLLHSPEYLAEPFLLAPDNTIWQLPYSYTLNHTTDEILIRCQRAEELLKKCQELLPSLQNRLNLSTKTPPQPRQLTLEQFCQEVKKENALLFLGLHGGDGENGTLQAYLDQLRIPYNGSKATASRLCMDKKATGEAILALKNPQLIAAPKIAFTLQDCPKSLWEDAVQEVNSPTLLIKPRADGCSAGVACLRSAEDLAVYLKAVTQREALLPPGSLSEQPDPIELPVEPDQFLLEPFIVTDEIRVDNGSLLHTPKTGWIELTAGVLEKEGHYHALTPSITVAEHAVLSLEEKFQGGTGVNLTPPPVTIMTESQLTSLKKSVELAAEALGIEGYARLDLFFNIRDNRVLLIEANSLPALTPSTVLFHQALAESPPLFPLEFLTRLVSSV